MKEYPIIFQGHNVVAIMDGRKTQTRRIDVARWLKRKKGDRLWVRETLVISDYDKYLGAFVEYVADGSPSGWTHDIEGVDISWGKDKRLIPSIHMPHWAARILLELTEDPYAERLQEITEEDAVAEGISGDGIAYQNYFKPDMPANQTARSSFYTLWESINAKRGYGWDANPMVAVVRFKLLDAVERAA